MTVEETRKSNGGHRSDALCARQNGLFKTTYWWHCSISGCKESHVSKYGASPYSSHLFKTYIYK